MAMVQHIGVVGAGTMGRGIAQVAAQSGFTVTLVDAIPEQVEAAQAAMARAWQRLHEKGRLAADQVEAARQRVQLGAGLAALAGCDLVIEAVVERLEVKCEVLRDLDGLCPPATVLASNTSSISITRLGAATGRPDRVIGMHFFNPVPAMPLVEVVRGERTSEATAALVAEVAQAMGKTAVAVNDVPGFVSNRLLCLMINEAIFALYEGVATREAIDTVMKLGMNHPMGPLELADLIGLDVVLDIMRVLHAGLGDDKYRPCPLLVRMVDAGRLGRKTGAGFYEYGT